MKASPVGMGRARIPQLDLLRGVAILLVLGHHPAVPEERAGVLSYAAEFWRRVGWSGVDLFFVLSGFLVGGLLLTEIRQRSTLNTGRFLIRRGFKIFPSYLAYLLFLFVFVVLHRDNPLVLWPNVLQVQDYFLSMRPHTWSLAVEEHFYLALPLLLGLLVRRKSDGVDLPGLPLLCLAFVVACTAFRVLANQRPDFLPERQQYPTHLRLDGLFFGVLLAYVRQFHPAWARRIQVRRAAVIASASVVVTTVAWFTYYSPFVRTWGFVLLYVGFGALLLAFVPVEEDADVRRPSAPAGRMLQFIGCASYPIYLWHWEVMLAIQHVHLPAAIPAAVAWLMLTALYLALATGVGVFFGKLIEAPGLALRERLFPSSTRPARVR